MSKYMLSEETKKITVGDDTVTLHRIISTSNFADVNIGDKGGWVESERNLSQDGISWIYDDSSVFSEAVVSGNATVQIDSIVSDNAIIKEEAAVSMGSKVSGSVVVTGNSLITGYAIVSGGLSIKNSIIMGPREVGGIDGSIVGVTMRRVF